MRLICCKKAKIMCFFFGVAIFRIIRFSHSYQTCFYRRRKPQYTVFILYRKKSPPGCRFHKSLILTDHTHSLNFFHLFLYPLKLFQQNLIHGFSLNLIQQFITSKSSGKSCCQYDQMKIYVFRPRKFFFQKHRYTHKICHSLLKDFFLALIQNDCHFCLWKLFPDWGYITHFQQFSCQFRCKHRIFLLQEFFCLFKTKTYFPQGMKKCRHPCQNQDMGHLWKQNRFMGSRHLKEMTFGSVCLDYRCVISLHNYLKYRRFQTGQLAAGCLAGSGCCNHSRLCHGTDFSGASIQNPPQSKQKGIFHMGAGGQKYPLSLFCQFPGKLHGTCGFSPCTDQRNHRFCRHISHFFQYFQHTHRHPFSNAQTSSSTLPPKHLALSDIRAQ